jgi:hypothetical protein
MSELNGLLQTHKHCSECGVLVPTHFLSCPSCLGFAKKRERWIVPGKPRPKKQPVQEPSFFDDAPEYPR